MPVIRKATVNDVKEIQKLITYHAKRDRMLMRSLNELYDNIRDFFIYIDGKKILGCCALHVGWEDLAEIKSLAVAKGKMKKGIGGQLIEYCLQDAKALKVRRVFALTYVPGFFKRFGFKVIAKGKLPHKIWSECIKCPYFPNCKEVALMRKI